MWIEINPIASNKNLRYCNDEYKNTKQKREIKSSLWTDGIDQFHSE